ncbi:MAG: amidohydrolase [Saprospiraceae bacterium]|jgi:amidohydrolase
MEELKSRIKTLAEAYHSTAVSYRRHLHQHPELSFEEYKTSEYVSDTIRSMGLEPVTGLGGGTGLYVDIGTGDRMIALRADMDALPITEEANHEYKSKNSGVMHACGHDVHTSSLLGVLHILNELKEELPFRVRCIFQPGEEKLPGGASKMIADGVLEKPDAQLIIGQHVHPSFECGTVGVKSEAAMASCDELYITIKGKGGHGALPHKVIDPIYVSAQVITGLQSIVSRHANPDTPSVLTIGKINSVGGATNVIPEEVKMEGTFRTFDEPWRQEAYKLIRQKIEGICAAHGATADINIMSGYPSLYNNPDVTAAVKEAMIDYLGRDNVIDMPLRMTAEDFSYYSQAIPACFYRLGTAAPDGTKNSPVHTPTFDVDENSLKVGIGLMAWIAINLGAEK